MSTVGELIHSLDKQQVLNTLKLLYQGPGEDPEGYKEVWDKLKNMQPKPTKIKVYLHQRQYFSNDEIYVHVAGVEPNDPQTYAIEYLPWEEWLEMEITTDKTLENLTGNEKLAHCLYEMTWAGYSQDQIADQLEEINDSVEEVQAIEKAESTGTKQ